MSTRSKHGATWMQMDLCAAGVPNPQLPGTLAWLSPWVDWLVMPKEELFARLKAQTDGRFVKSTPRSMGSFWTSERPTSLLLVIRSTRRCRGATTWIEIESGN